MPYFPKIFWRIKFYPAIKNSNIADEYGVILCTDGNLFAHYNFDLGLSFMAQNNPKTSRYFCSADSETEMFTFSSSTKFTNDIVIECTITIMFDSYIGGHCLKQFQYGHEILSKQNYCDFVIKVQDQSFNVHKCILSTHWSYFDNLLKSGMAETSSGILTIEDATADVIEAIIYYIYTGTSNVTDVNLALELVTVSDKYDLPDLKMKSLKFLVSKMNKYCVVKCILMAKFHGLNALLQACVNFLKNDGGAITDLPNYHLLVESENAIELLALCFDNVRGIKRKLTMITNGAEE